ncbi:GNAT family N-acetyltransferase [Peptoclostridium sp. AF21-18]|uniref:GNAT family N-acetyltransferase n=1 Tax=Peptoclostridium sp. AF21-18 TaxID=2292243 RepID=UPI000E51B16F|nr:GNAT family N-acetyltransferase [Peptoclostridium sp. AF21-18]RHQ95216.1 GNAT family N-acetyltransferase [Peptoclostridium sp. AF21-18]
MRIKATSKSKLKDGEMDLKRFTRENNYTVSGCNGSDKAFLVDKLVDYNLSQVPATQEENFIDLSRKVLSEDGKILAGIIVRMYCWRCIYIDTFWIDESMRGEDLGTLLLEEVERVAKENGSHLIHLDTFDFQAKDFYLAHGYSVFGELEDCPKGHTRYFMSKVL